jgi:hypothetical protein
VKLDRLPLSAALKDSVDYVAMNYSAEGPEFDGLVTKVRQLCEKY